MQRLMKVLFATGTLLAAASIANPPSPNSGNCLRRQGVLLDAAAIMDVCESNTVYTKTGVDFSECTVTELFEDGQLRLRCAGETDAIWRPTSEVGFSVDCVQPKSGPVACVGNEVHFKRFQSDDRSGSLSVVLDTGSVKIKEPHGSITWQDANSLSLAVEDFKDLRKGDCVSFIIPEKDGSSRREMGRVDGVFANGKVKLTYGLARIEWRNFSAVVKRVSCSAQ